MSSTPINKILSELDPNLYGDLSSSPEVGVSSPGGRVQGAHGTNAATNKTKTTPAFSSKKNSSSSFEDDKIDLSSPVSSDDDALSDVENDAATQSLNQLHDGRVILSPTPRTPATIKKRRAETPNAKRVREIVEEELDGTPSTKKLRFGASSKQNEQQNNIVGIDQSTILHASSYYNLRVRCDEEATKHARERYDTMNNAALREQGTLDFIHGRVEKREQEQAHAEAALRRDVREMKEEVQAVLNKHNGKIKRRKEDLERAQENVQEIKTEEAIKEKEICSLEAGAAEAYTEFQERSKTLLVMQHVHQWVHRDSKVRNNVLQNLTSSELCSVFDLKAPRDILGIGYKQVNKHFAFPLIRGGHKKADALYPYAQQVTGDGIKQRSKVLKEMLFGIFYPDDECPELNDAGKMVPE